MDDPPPELYRAFSCLNRIDDRDWVAVRWFALNRPTLPVPLSVALAEYGLPDPTSEPDFPMQFASTVFGLGELFTAEECATLRRLVIRQYDPMLEFGDASLMRQPVPLPVHLGSLQPTSATTSPAFDATLFLDGSTEQLGFPVFGVYDCCCGVPTVSLTRDEEEAGVEFFRHVCEQLDGPPPDEPLVRRILHAVHDVGGFKITRAAPLEEREEARLAFLDDLQAASEGRDALEPIELDSTTATTEQEPNDV